MVINKKIMLVLSSLAIGAIVFAGGTMALFTSTTENKNNEFAAGLLEVNIDKPDGVKYFDLKELAPGDKGEASLKVKNSGTLEMRYYVDKDISGELSEGINGIRVWVESPTGDELLNTDDRTLAPDDTDELLVRYEMPLSSENDYQGKEGRLAIRVKAVQAKNNP